MDVTEKIKQIEEDSKWGLYGHRLQHEWRRAKQVHMLEQEIIRLQRELSWSRC